jgi:hypothetical protein
MASVSAAELLPEIQALPRLERLRLVQDILASLEREEESTSEMSWERDPQIAARLRESIAQAKSGQLVEATLIDP